MRSPGHNERSKRPIGHPKIRHVEVCRCRAPGSPPLLRNPQVSSPAKVSAWTCAPWSSTCEEPNSSDEPRLTRLRCHGAGDLGHRPGAERRSRVPDGCPHLRGASCRSRSRPRQRAGLLRWSALSRWAMRPYSTTKGLSRLPLARPHWDHIKHPGKSQNFPVSHSPRAILSQSLHPALLSSLLTFGFCQR